MIDRVDDNHSQLDLCNDLLFCGYDQHTPFRCLSRDSNFARGLDQEEGGCKHLQKRACSAEEEEQLYMPQGGIT